MDHITAIFSALTSGARPASISFWPFIFSFSLLFPKLVSAPGGQQLVNIFVSVRHNGAAVGGPGAALLAEQLKPSGAAAGHKPGPCPGPDPAPGAGTAGNGRLSCKSRRIRMQKWGGGLGLGCFRGFCAAEGSAWCTRDVNVVLV